MLMGFSEQIIKGFPPSHFCLTVVPMIISTIEFPQFVCVEETTLIRFS